MSRYNRFVKRLMKEMTARGYTAIRVYDGEEWFETDLIENVTATDMGAIRFTKGDNGITFSLIYGNAYYETISDYSWSNDDAQKDADEVSTLVYDFFEKLSNIYN